jgi:transcriptional regulator with XRE-family HTH domain
MAQKRKPMSKFGRKMIPNRPARGASDDLYYATYTQALAMRVRAAKKRIGLTWLDFEDRIGMTEKTRMNRTRGKNPTPFTVEEIARICAALEVRPEYLLLGTGDMIELPTVAREDQNFQEPLNQAVYGHLVRRLGVRFDADREGITSRLPKPATLLVAIERGVGDAWADNFGRDIENRVRLAGAVRAAVRNTWQPPESSTETVRKLARELVKKTAPRLSTAVAVAAAEAAHDEETTTRGSEAIRDASARARRAYERKGRRPG